MLELGGHGQRSLLHTCDTRKFFSIPSDADTGSLVISICTLAKGKPRVDHPVVWCLANARVCEL